VLDRYIQKIDANIISGQDGKTGMWYCKELPTKNTKETDKMIGELNRIYNKYNTEIEKRNKTKKDKDKKKE